MLRGRRIAVLLAISSLAAGAGACGGGDRSPAPPSPVATANHNESSTGEPRGVPPRPGERYLIVLKRITAVADPWDDEVRVSTDGIARYRIYLGGHTTANGRTGQRITARRFARLRTLVRTARLKGAGRTGVKATPGGYYYTLHVRGRVVATADGHLARGVRPLIGELNHLIDALTSHVRF